MGSGHRSDRDWRSDQRSVQHPADRRRVRRRWGSRPPRSDLRHLDRHRPAVDPLPVHHPGPRVDIRPHRTVSVTGVESETDSPSPEPTPAHYPGAAANLAHAPGAAIPEGARSSFKAHVPHFSEAICAPTRAGQLRGLAEAWPTTVGRGVARRPAVTGDPPSR